MGMGSRPRGGLLAEINVTPLVDVMLVLLIIFMITASVEKEQKKKDKERDKQEELRRMVPLKLPTANAPTVVKKTDKKLVLSIDDKLGFHLDDTNLNLNCKVPQKGIVGCDEKSSTYRTCMKALADKLLENQKLQQDKELYLRADRNIPYGCVLRAMSTIRKAGIVKFGLIALPDVTTGTK